MKTISGNDYLELLNETLTDPTAIRELHEARLDRLRLTVTGANEAPEEEPPAVTEWLGRLRLLHGVPFHYLVAEPRMLPPESIRFFYVDPNWLHYLEDGAFSVGRTSELELAHDEALAGEVLKRAMVAASSLRPRLLGLEQNTTADAAGFVTGFLVRSSAVKEWPGMEVAAFDASGLQLLPLRIEELGPTVLFALFAGDLQRVRITKPAETLHFGTSEGLKKILRGPDGRLTPDKSVEVPLRDPERRVLDVAGLAERMRVKLGSERFTSADLALQMVGGAEQVVFEKQERDWNS